MATFTKFFASEDTARRAVETLRAASVSPREIRLLTSRALRDVRREPTGGFAGPVGPDAPVGNFGGLTRRRSDNTGSFATGSFAGDPGHRRRGSFGDTERVTVVTYKSGVERSRITGYRGTRLLLRRLALEDAVVDRMVAELNSGRAVVFADVPEIASDEAEAQLGRLAQAA